MFCQRTKMELGNVGTYIQLGVVRVFTKYLSFAKKKSEFSNNIFIYMKESVAGSPFNNRPLGRS